MIQGKIYQAEEEILNISLNIYPDVYNKLISKEYLNFYLILTMLICFKKHIINSIVSFNNNI